VFFFGQSHVIDPIQEAEAIAKIIGGERMIACCLQRELA
jgi:hypothetical protein